MIQPRTLRQQMAGETLASVEPAPEDSPKLGITHLRRYVSVRLLGTAAALTYAIYSLASGNIISGVIFGVIAFLTASTLVLSGAVARAWRRPPHGSPPEPDKSDNAGGA